MTELSFLRCPVCGWISKCNIKENFTPNLKVCICPVCHVIKKGEDGFGHQQRLEVISSAAKK